MHGEGEARKPESDGGRAFLDDDEDDDVNFPVASASTLHQLLSQPPPLPPSLRGDEAVARRHEVAAAVHASWTQRGTEVAGLAERYEAGDDNVLFSPLSPSRRWLSLPASSFCSRSPSLSLVLSAVSPFQSIYFHIAASSTARSTPSTT